MTSERTIARGTGFHGLFRHYSQIDFILNDGFFVAVVVVSSCSIFESPREGF